MAQSCKHMSSAWVMIPGDHVADHDLFSWEPVSLSAPPPAHVHPLSNKILKKKKNTLKNTSPSPIKTTKECLLPRREPSREKIILIRKERTLNSEIFSAVVFLHVFKKVKIKLYFILVYKKKQYVKETLQSTSKIKS